MSENVIALPGFSIPTPKGEPVGEVVEILEELLALAQAGQLVGLTASYVLDDGTECMCIDHRLACRQNSSFALSASLRRLNHYFDEHFLA